MKLPLRLKYDKLYHYTDLPSAIHILRRQQLCLRSYQGWKDRNDAYFLEQYQKHTGYLSVLALCFTSAGESSHHWQSFASGNGGVRLDFKASSLIGDAVENGDIRWGRVKYLKIDKARARLSPNTLPFIKRWPYRDEAEVRVIFASTTDQVLTYGLSFELSSLLRIAISPWLPAGLVKDVKFALKSIPDCNSLDVIQSTLANNERWKKIAEIASSSSKRRHPRVRRA